MKLPEGMLFTTNEFFRTDRNARIAFQDIVRDCAGQCHRNMYHGTTAIPTINAANHALSDCYKAVLARYELEPEDSHE